MVKFDRFIGWIDVGDDVRIDPEVRIKHPELITIGNHVAIDYAFYCTTKLQIGDYCHISSHVSVIGGADALLHMGNFSHLAAGARLIVYGDANLGEGLVSPVIPERYRDDLYGGYIEIGDFASVLTNAVIMPNIIIPEGVVIGANSLVTEKCYMRPWEIWVGSPAHLVGNRPHEKMLQYAREMGYEYSDSPKS